MKYAPTVSSNSYHQCIVQKLYSCAFIKREGRRLRMLWDLPGIQHRSVFVRWHSLGEYFPSWHLLSPSVFRIAPPNTIFGFGSNIITFFSSAHGSSSIPKWDARCKCMNAKNGNMRCITYKHFKISTRLHHMTWAPREQVIYIKSNIEIAWHASQLKFSYIKHLLIKN